MQAGLGEVDHRRVRRGDRGLGLAGWCWRLALFGGLAAGAGAGAVPGVGAAGVVPGAGASGGRRRRSRGPGIIEEIRILTSSLGRSVPQALFEAGRRAPDEPAPAFAAAQREWLLSTDFERTVSVLKAGLADPTADAACETLLVAHEVGGTDLDRRLEALIEDRVIDVQGRKDARSSRPACGSPAVRPAGAARHGARGHEHRQRPGRLRHPGGQLMVVAGIAAVVACWVWAGRLLALPEEERVFYE